jgi:hypothetical protein
LNKLRQLFLLVLIANVAVFIWLSREPASVVYQKPETDPGVPGLVLRQEYLQLQPAMQRLQANACWRIGPFQTERQMQSAWKSLEYVALDMQQSSSVNRINQGYTLTIPPSATFQQAEQVLQKIVQAGIADAHIYENGPLTNAIFLGQFEQLDLAMDRQKIVQSQGLEVELRSLQTELVQWWIQATIRNTEGFMQWQKELKPAVPVSECL